MSDEESFLPKLAKKPERRIETLAPDASERFLERKLMLGIQPQYENALGKMWEMDKKTIDMPGIGPAFLYIRYYQEFKDPRHAAADLDFDSMRFDFTNPNEKTGESETVAEMWWKRNAPGAKDKYPYDLLLTHRYVEPKFRGGAGTYTYGIAEAWAQQLADLRGTPVTLAMSTDQPLTMDWAEKLGYAVVPEEAELLQEIREHPERFELSQGDSVSGQERNPGITRGGEEVRVWFTKTLAPRKA